MHLTRTLMQNSRTLRIGMVPADLVHMATSGAPAAEPLTTTPRRRVVIPNVISYSRLKPIVERTCQRKLDVPDFRRLVWLWSHAPGSEVDSRFTDEVAVERQGGMGFFCHQGAHI